MRRKLLQTGILCILLAGMASICAACGDPGQNVGTGDTGNLADSVTDASQVADGGTPADDAENAGISADTSNTVVSDAETDTITPEEEPTTEVVILEITVMGSKYLYQNQEITLEAFLAEINAQTGDRTVSVTDSNATQNAMEDLLQALENADVTYELN